MEVTANKQYSQPGFFDNGKEIDAGISVFYKDERKTVKGVHVGTVWDVERLSCARIGIYGWARIKRNTSPDNLIQALFNGVI